MVQRIAGHYPMHNQLLYFIPLLFLLFSSLLSSHSVFRSIILLAFLKVLHKMLLQTPAINDSFFLSSFLLIPNNSWCGQTMYSCHLTPSLSLDSTSTNICCVQSRFQQRDEGVGCDEVKPISMQILVTSCVLPPPSSSLYWWSSPEGLLGKMFHCWMGHCYQQAVVSQIPTNSTTVNEPGNVMCSDTEI